MNPAGSAPVSPTVSVILPALDEELTIGNCIQKIQTVFLDNSIAGRDPCCRRIHGSDGRDCTIAGRNRHSPGKKGYGNAYLAAFEQARGQYLVLGDADDTYDFLEIPQLLAPPEKRC